MNAFDMSAFDVAYRMTVPWARMESAHRRQDAVVYSYWEPHRIAEAELPARDPEPDLAGLGGEMGTTPGLIVEPDLQGTGT